MKEKLMEQLDRKLEQVDFVFVSGDGYVDHPSFAAALLGRLLEQNGYPEHWKKLGF